MNNFDEIEFKYTDDYSVGLYDKKVCDILHSNTGALKEAYEKFVNPAEILIKNLKTNKINVLDICYGIGYNSKAFLHKYKDIEVKIDALEIKKELVLISPFITDKIEDNELKLFLLNKIIQNGADIKEVYSAVSRAELKSKSNYFSSFYSVFKGVFNDIRYELHPSESYNLFLHNIYYKYISNNNNIDINFNKYNKSNLNIKIGDARTSIDLLNNYYDIVFLDAFTPQKDPSLWTLDFLKKIKCKLKDNSLLISYSKSTPFRSALFKLGFFVGKTFINDIDMGTTASLNPKLIFNPVNDYDINLFNTRAGIFYRDINLNLSPSEILRERELKISSSDRISHTQFFKNFKQ